MSKNDNFTKDECEFLTQTLNQLHSKIGKSSLRHYNKELDDIYNRAFSSLFDLYVAYGGEVECMCERQSNSK